jgi:sortase B
MEDDFDLDRHKRVQEKKAVFKEFREKNQKLINILTAMIVILAFVIAWLGYNVISYYIALWQNYKINRAAVEMLANKPADAAPEQPSETPAANAFAPLNDQPIQEHLADLRQSFQNDDIIAYLNILDTNINFPVVQEADNSYYLTHDLHKDENVAGSAFMDYENRPDVKGYNTVIYAHNMRNGSMFHNLRYYADKAYYETHDLITLETLYDTTVWEIFSFYVSKVDFNYIQIDFTDQEDFYTRLLKVVKEKSEYDTGVEVQPGDKMLTLSTCTNRIEDTRYVIHARLLERN